MEATQGSEQLTLATLRVCMNPARPAAGIARVPSTYLAPRREAPPKTNSNTQRKRTPNPMTKLHALLDVFLLVLGLSWPCSCHITDSMT